MMFVSFNVNSIRTRLHQLEAVIDQLNPDFIGLQETKVRDEEFPEDEIRQLGYHVHFHGQKTHYGVALLSRQAPDEGVEGHPAGHDDGPRRLVPRRLNVYGGPLAGIHRYFPQGESRRPPVEVPAKTKVLADLDA